MSGGSIAAIIAGSIAATTAAAAAKKKREEEENMTKYDSDDLDGWEFKIVRANTRKFKNSEMIEKVKQEEAQSGWELVEKFDDYRLRFKRRVEKRSLDAHLEADPYRSQVGSDNSTAIALIVGILIALVGIFILFGSRGGFDGDMFGGITGVGLIMGLVVVIGIIAAIVAVTKNK